MLWVSLLSPVEEIHMQAEKASLSTQHTLHLSQVRPGPDKRFGRWELQRDRWDRDELIPFLREWSKLFKTNNQALSPADACSTVDLRDEILMRRLSNEWFSQYLKNKESKKPKP